MKKKLINVSVIALVLILTLSMTACGDDKESDSSNGEALKLYNAANKQLNETDSYSATTDMTMSMDISGQKMEMTNKGDIKQANNEDGKIDMEMDMTTSASGQDTNVKAYYTDGFYYMDMSGQKMKMEMDIDQVRQQANNGIIEIPDNAVKEQSVKDTDDGKEITMLIDGEKIMSDSSGAFGGLDQLSAAAEDLKMGDISLIAVIDGDGNFKTSNIKFSFDLTAQEQKTSSDAEMTMTITKIGGVEVEFPKDLDSYTEASGDISG